MKKYELRYLSKEFYEDYPSDKYPEIENKPTRPYMVLLVKIDDNTFAIPFRTNIHHKYCYKFKNSDRPTTSKTALDYTKAIIINDLKYIGDVASIDNKEYVELDGKYFFIISRLRNYVEGYIKYMNENDGNDNPKYKYTTLKYFHNELGIKNPAD